MNPKPTGHLLALLATLALVLGACSTDTESIPSGDLGLVFTPAEGALAELVGTSFDGDSLPAVLGGGAIDPLGGSAIVNAGSQPSDEVSVAMHWFEADGHANFVLSAFGGRNATGIATWDAESAWRLDGLAADHVLTIGTLVCAAPLDTFDSVNGQFVAVTNRDQDRALAAWTMTPDGPTAYDQLTALDCERFVP